MLDSLAAPPGQSANPTAAAREPAVAVPSPRAVRAAAVAAAGAIAVGILLRSIQYFSRPALLLDEVRLSLEIAARSWPELARPLDYDQAAPLLFLWLEKAAVSLGGVNEYALRALPFLSSIALLPLLYRCGSRLIGVAGGVLAVSIAALSPLLLQYTRQVKPYAVDALVTLALLEASLSLAARPRDRRAAVRLLLAGTIAVWLSIPAVFVLAAIVVAFTVGCGAERPRLGEVVTAAVAWGGSFAAAYGLTYLPAAGNEYMQQFWAGSLLTPWRSGFWERLGFALREFFWQIFIGGETTFELSGFEGFATGAGALALALLAVGGIYRLWQRHGALRVTLLIGPFGVAFLASMAGLYPISARTMLFAVPAAVLAVSAGALHIVTSVSPAHRRLVTGLVYACLLVPPIPLAAVLSLRPTIYENVREGVAELQQRRAPGEPVYIFTAAVPGWTFYTTDWAAPDHARLARMARLASFGGPAFENAPPRGRSVGVEGDSLLYPFLDTRELIGLAHGLQRIPTIGLLQPAPDSNWIPSEARRLRSAAQPSIWVFLIRSSGLEHDLIRASGLRVSDAVQRNGFNLFRLIRAEGDSVSACCAARD